jgi:hypothetical protein
MHHKCYVAAAMKSLRAPNPVDVAIGVAIATTPYWANWFVTTTLPLWTVVAGLGLGVGAFLLLGGLRRWRAEKRSRDRTDRELRRAILEQLSVPADESLVQPSVGLDGLETPPPGHAGADGGESAKGSAEFS